MKLPQVEAKLSHADGRTDTHTDMRKLILIFHNLANVPKKVGLYSDKPYNYCRRRGGSLSMHQRIAVKNFGCIFNFVFGMRLYAKRAGFCLNF